MRMAYDECEPPTILAENKNKAYTFVYTLKSHDDAIYHYEPLVYEPAHCTAAHYDATLDHAASDINNDDEGSGMAFDAAFDFDVIG